MLAWLLAAEAWLPGDDGRCELLMIGKYTVTIR